MAGLAPNLAPCIEPRNTLGKEQQIHGQKGHMEQYLPGIRRRPVVDL